MPYFSGERLKAWALKALLPFSPCLCIWWQTMLTIPMLISVLKLVQLMPPVTKFRPQNCTDNCAKPKVTDKTLWQPAEKYQYACREYEEYFNPTSRLQILYQFIKVTKSWDFARVEANGQMKYALLELCYWPYSIWWPKRKEIETNPRFSNPTLLYPTNS